MTLLLPPAGGEPRDVSTAVNQALKGKLNCTGTVTLSSTGSTSTLVKDARISKSSIVLLMAQSSDAISLDGYAWVDPANITEGTSFKISHNNSTLNRKYGYAILG